MNASVGVRRQDRLPSCSMSEGLCAASVVSRQQLSAGDAYTVPVPAPLRRRFVDEWVLVDERDIAQAVLATISHTGAQVEGERPGSAATCQQLAAHCSQLHPYIGLTPRLPHGMATSSRALSP